MCINLNKQSLILLPLLWLFLPFQLFAGWSGVSFTLGDQTIPIQSTNNLDSLTPFILRLAVEDKTAQGLRIGISIAKVGLDLETTNLNNDTSSEAIALFFYYPYEFNEHLGLTGSLSIERVSASQENANDETIEYLSKTASLGLNIKWQNIRITPIINFINLEGDYNDPTGSNASFSFSHQHSQFTSLNIDYFVEESSFVRFNTSEHSDGTFIISFSTIY